MKKKIISILLVSILLIGINSPKTIRANENINIELENQEDISMFGLGGAIFGGLVGGPSKVLTGVIIDKVVGHKTTGKDVVKDIITGTITGVKQGIKLPF